MSPGKKNSLKNKQSFEYAFFKKKTTIIIPFSHEQFITKTVVLC